MELRGFASRRVGTMATRQEATIEDLYHVPENGKAEIVNGELVLMPPTGGGPGRVGGEIFVSLRLYEREKKLGLAFPDNVGFLVDLPNRKSFSPDAAFYMGDAPSGLKFVQGAPIFAAEVRSEGDYVPTAEREMARKRADYFSAGTQVVWDIDLVGTDVVRVYRASDPERPTIYRRGEVAGAEPALPGWTMHVDDLFT
jgi:Uma2 family endonuclease